MHLFWAAAWQSVLETGLQKPQMDQSEHGENGIADKTREVACQARKAIRTIEIKFWARKHSRAVFNCLLLTAIQKTIIVR